ncbi:auxin efflux carrier family protein [Wolffia australiana]
MAGGFQILAAVVPLLKLLTLTLIGLVLGHPRTQIVPRATFRLLSKLVFVLFLPCLIFVHLGQSVTLSSALQWWFVPANVLLSTALGCALGYAVFLLCRPPPDFLRFTVIMTGFGNTGNLPIAIVGSVCHSPGNPFRGDCYASGVAFVSFAQWVAVILVYTLVFHIMEPPLAPPPGPDHADSSAGPDLSRPLLHEAEWPGVADQETALCKTPFIASVFASFSGADKLDLARAEPEEENDDVSPRSIRCMAEPRVVRRMRTVAEQTPLQHVLQPPTIASLLAIAVGATPAVKGFVFGDGAPLGFLTDSLDIMAGAMVPSVMLVLGGMLAEGPRRRSVLGRRTTVGIVVARLLVLPLVGIGVVALAGRLGFLIEGEGDKLYRFVLLMQYTTPSAILLGAIASLRGYAVAESSSILFWQHVFAVLSLSFYIVIYFRILSYV